MKNKILSLIMVASAMFIFSCTSENDKVTEDHNGNSAFIAKSLNTTDLTDAKQLYKDMMATQEYADFKTAINDFNTKLKVHNVSFSNKKDWMDWINVNISGTNFSSVADFEELYDTMVSKADVMIAANTRLYNFMGNADQGQIIQIIEPGQNNPPAEQTNQTPCENSCMDACDISLDYAWFDYVDAYSYAVLGHSYGWGLSEAVANVEQDYQDAYNAIVYDLNICLSGC